MSEQTFDLAPIAAISGKNDRPIGVLLVIFALISAAAMAAGIWLILAGRADAYQALLAPGGALGILITYVPARSLLTPYPDQFVVGDSGWRARTGGKPDRSGLWSDPSLNLMLMDWSRNPVVLDQVKSDPDRAKLLIRLGGVGGYRLSTRSFNITRAAAEALVRSAKTAGVSVSEAEGSLGPAASDKYVEIRFRARPLGTSSA